MFLLSISAVKVDAFTVTFVELGAPPAPRFFFHNGPMKGTTVTAASGVAVASVDTAVLPNVVIAYTVHMADACISCVGDVETLTTALAFAGSQRMQARDVHVDVRRSTVSGCLVSIGCVSGAFAAALVPAYGAAYSVVADEARTCAIMTDDSFDGGPDPEPPGPKPEPDTGFGTGVIALIDIGSVAAVPAIGYAVYRVVAHKRSLEPAFDEGLLNGVGIL
jgi:hypothetical protein